MNTLSNFGKRLMASLVVAMAVQFNVQAQNPVESTRIDEKYAYTTVVYKNKAADDKDVLASLSNDFSIGDVVRVTLAPPPSEALTAIAASEPVYADKSKGEDTWLPNTANAFDNLTASTDLAIKTNLDTKAIATAPKAIVIEKPAVALNKPLVEAAPVTISGTGGTAQPQALNNMTGKKAGDAAKTTKAHKSPKKSGKKGGSKMKFKNRKKGPHRYAIQLSDKKSPCSFFAIRAASNG